MKLFSRGVYLKSFGEIYLALKKGWLKSEEILKYCVEGFVVCSKERLVELYVANDESLYEFVNLIKLYIEQDDGVKIDVNEDSKIQNLDIIPKRYWKFWEVEFLLRLIKSDLNKEEKLYKIEPLFIEFNYPEEWHKFLYYMSSKDNTIGIDSLFDNLEVYVNARIAEMKID